MKKIKVMSVFGTRPEAIKMAPLVKELAGREEIDSLVCVTGQHREMVDQMMTEFAIKPDFDLDIMEKSQTLSRIAVKSLTGLEELLTAQQPDLVLVHGDTSATFVTSLAAFYQKIKVGHVEAGLRSFDKMSPFPEEMNRRLTGKIADIHFAPTAANRDNLVREGITEDIFITGNTVIDALKLTVKDDYRFESDYLNTIDFSARKVIMMTAHRRENYGEPMENIMGAAARIARQHSDVLIVYPVHLSPYVGETARKYLGDIANIALIPPIGVADAHNLMKRCYMVMTDSGGLQEEAPSLGKPVLVLRRETERPEAVVAGTVKMTGVAEDDIVRDAHLLLTNKAEYEKMSKAVNPYGDGNACVRIADDILYYFGLKAAPAPNFGINK